MDVVIYIVWLYIQCIFVAWCVLPLPVLLARGPLEKVFKFDLYKENLSVFRAIFAALGAMFASGAFFGTGPVFVHLNMGARPLVASLILIGLFIAPYICEYFYGKSPLHPDSPMAWTDKLENLRSTPRLRRSELRQHQEYVNHLDEQAELKKQQLTSRRFLYHISHSKGLRIYAIVLFGGLSIAESLSFIRGFASAPLILAPIADFISFMAGSYLIFRIVCWWDDFNYRERRQAAEQIRALIVDQRPSRMKRAVNGIVSIFRW